CGSRPRNRTHPAFDSFPRLVVGADRWSARCCWWVSTLVDTVDPRHAWMRFDEGSKYSISIGFHPRMAWIY
ncbi:hypothetical protein ACWWU7_19905, partial [Stenotrophomonas sp. SM006]